MRARVALAAAATIAVGAAPGAWAAGDPTLRLADVKAGMDCKARTVIRGTAITEFDAAVIDVVRGDSNHYGPRILLRVSGPAVDATGIGPGFSGSPVYCPGAGGILRNIGAISEGVGEYGNKLALATPIEEMLGDKPDPPAGTRRAPALLRSARRLATPLTITGLSAPLRSAVTRAARRAGAPLLAAPAGPAFSFPAYALQPGSAISAGLATGDIAIGAIGTVAYRDGSSVWAFGHFLDGVGRRAMPLTDAYVFSVVNNPLALDEGAITYKLAAPGPRVLGTLSNDTVSGIVGRVGPGPRTIPLTVRAKDLDSGRTAAVHSEVTDERQLDLGTGLDLVSSAAFGQAAVAVMRSEPPRLRAKLCLRVRVKEAERRLGFCNEYFDVSSAFDSMAQAFALVDGFAHGPLTPTGAGVDVSLRRGVPEAFILGAKGPRAVRRGQKIRIRLALRRLRGPKTSLAFDYRIPRSLGSGPRVLRLTGQGSSGDEFSEELGDELVEIIFDLGGGSSSGPKSLGKLRERIRELGKPDGLRASFSRKRRGPVVLPRPDILLSGEAKLRLVVRSKRGDRR